jgi:hypothetical protein
MTEPLHFTLDAMDPFCEEECWKVLAHSLLIDVMTLIRAIVQWTY